MESALSGLSAVVGGTFGDVVKDKRLRRLAIECMRETAEIGETNGVFFEPINGQNIVPLLLDDHQFSKRALDLCLLKMVKPYFHIESPMLQDIRSHQRCDTRAIQGTICEYGDRYGIEAPINRRIESVLIQMERGEMPIMYDNYRILMMP